jgi:hypothetical protein
MAGDNGRCGARVGAAAAGSAASSVVMDERSGSGAERGAMSCCDLADMQELLNWQIAQGAWRRSLADPVGIGGVSPSIASLFQPWAGLGRALREPWPASVAKLGRETP